MQRFISGLSRLNLIMGAKFQLVLVILSVIGFLGVLISSMGEGVSWSPLWATYLSTARNLLQGRGFTTYLDTPTVLVPPLYSSLLALTAFIIKEDPVTIANYFNAPLYGLIVYLAGLLAYRAYRSSILAILTSLLTLTSIPLFTYSLHARTEILFITLLTLGFLAVWTYLESKKLYHLAWAAVFISLSALTRYVGVYVIIWGALVILFSSVKPLTKKIFHLSIFLFITIVPIGAWCIRNYSLTHTLFGFRAPSITPLSEILIETPILISYWFIPGIKSLPPTFGILVLLLLIFFMLGLIIRERKVTLKELSLHLKPLLLFSSFIVIFLSMVVHSTATIKVEAAGGRYAAPLFIPLTLILLLLGRVCFNAYRAYFPSRLLLIFLLFVGGLWLVIHPLRIDLINALFYYRQGGGYRSIAWKQSETLAFLRENFSLFSSSALYTNDPPAIYLHTNITPKYFPLSDPRARIWICDAVGIEDYIKPFGSVRWPEEEKAYLVWLDKARMVKSGLEDLYELANLELMKRFEDGSIYVVTSKGAPSAPVGE